MNKLITMTNKQIQEWLRKIDTETNTNTLAMALLGANDEIIYYVFRNMSATARTVLNNSIQEQNKNQVKNPKYKNVLVNLFN